MGQFFFILFPLVRTSAPIEDRNGRSIVPPWHRPTQYAWQDSLRRSAPNNATGRRCARVRAELPSRSALLTNSPEPEARRIPDANGTMKPQRPGLQIAPARTGN